MEVHLVLPQLWQEFQISTSRLQLQVETPAKMLRLDENRGICRKFFEKSVFSAISTLTTVPLNSTFPSYRGNSGLNTLSL